MLRKLAVSVLVAAAVAVGAPAAPAEAIGPCRVTHGLFCPLKRWGDPVWYAPGWYGGYYWDGGFWAGPAAPTNVTIIVICDGYRAYEAC